MSDPIRYRRVAKDAMLTTSELCRSIHALEPAQAGDPKPGLIGRWYCHGEDCDVRTVDIPGVTFRRKACCPLCSGPLELVSVLRIATLIPETP